LQNLWKDIWPSLLDKGLLAVVLLAFGYCFNRRLESFKLRQTSRREFLHTRAEMIREALGEMSAFQLAIIDLNWEVKKEGQSATILEARKKVVEDIARHLLIQMGARQPWLGEELTTQGCQFVGLGQKALEQAKKSGATDDLERQMANVEISFVRSARQALGEEK
jgi:hypothetical protein